MIREAISETAARGHRRDRGARGLARARRPRRPPSGARHRAARGPRACVAEERGTDEHAAAKELKRSDESRADFLKRFYGVEHEQASHYDLVVNTEVLGLTAPPLVVVDAAKVDRTAPRRRPAPRGRAPRIGPNCGRWPSPLRSPGSTRSGRRPPPLPGRRPARTRTMGRGRRSPRSPRRPNGAARSARRVRGVPPARPDRTDGRGDRRDQRRALRARDRADGTGRSSTPSGSPTASGPLGSRRRSRSCADSSTAIA